MRRIIRGDIRRVLLKPGFYVLPVIYLVFSLSGLSSGKEYGFEDMYTTMVFAYKYIVSYFAILPVFMGIYVDELKSDALVIAIGRGMSRKKIILAKFLDGVILTVLLFAVFFASDLVTFAFYMITPTSLQMTRAALLVVAACVKAIGAMGFASIFVYLSWNASAGIVVEIITVAFAQTALNWIQEHLRIPLLDISLIGQADQACANLAAGKPWFIQSGAVILYLALFIVISIVVFNRKELEL